MPKKKTRSHPTPRSPRHSLPTPAGVSPRTVSPQELVREGQRAFKSRHYVQAIELWQQIDPPTRELIRALAEAHFRQAVISEAGADVLSHLQRALTLIPDDALYTYHLGLALHKQGRLVEALEQYRRAAARGLVRPGSGLSIGLAALELDPRANLATAPGVTAGDRQALAPVARLLQAKPGSEASGSCPPSVTATAGQDQGLTTYNLLCGLELLATGQYAEAYQGLGVDEARAWPRPTSALRHYYRGVAAARVGDQAGSIASWQQARRSAPDLGILNTNLATVYARQATAQAEAGDWPAAAARAIEGLNLAPDHAALGALALKALDQAAHDAARANDWAQAANYWSQARDVLGLTNIPGSPRPILHNLALAYEANSQWAEAAEAWRAMLRTRPRKKALEGFSDEHWAWVRRHTIACYKQANLLGEAVTIFRQAIKADPDDEDLPLDLAEVLAADGRAEAAVNELEKSLARHPQNTRVVLRLAELYGAQENWAAAEMALKGPLEAEPEHRELRQRMGHVLAQRAEQCLEWGQPAQARQIYEQALRYAPDDYSLYLDLADLEFHAHRTKAAREHIEHALDLGRTVPDAYEQAFACWISEGQLMPARDILSRAEANTVLPPEAYMRMGTMCIEQATQSPPGKAGDGLVDLFAHRPKRGRGKGDALAMQALGDELLERALALGPEVGLLRAILSRLVLVASHAAIPYARRLLGCAPEEPMAHLMLGLVLGMDQQAQEARQVLRDAERLARRQGNRELAQTAKQLASEVGSPFFAMMMRLLPFKEAFSGDGPDYE